MAKATEEAIRYSIFNALISGVICGFIAFLIGFLITEEIINHNFESLLPYISIGIILSILNFKHLSKLAFILLPPAYGISGFGIVAGPIFMYKMGIDKNNISENLAILIENIPFLIFATFLFNWYSALAGKKSFIIYAVFAISSVMISILIFKNCYEQYILEAIYLGLGAFFFSLLHVR
ncbi:MAG: hypothetical protein MK207_10940 [Saprospiraceae bacterium]|nr:hypothetical protein [Saprospiraceae bacterium]